MAVAVLHCQVVVIARHSLIAPLTDVYVGCARWQHDHKIVAVPAYQNILQHTQSELITVESFSRAGGKRSGSHELSTHTGFVKSPDTFLQPLLSPPQIPHLSNFLSEPIFPSQPALMHFPWTHTPVESGEHGVPSTTCLGSHWRLDVQVDHAG